MTLHPLRILIVDDCADDAELICRALRCDGFEPDAVRVDTPAALTAALDTKHSWDVIACDVQMPCLDPARVVHDAYTKRPQVPVVLVAGSYPHSLWHELGSGLAKAFVSKRQLERLAATVRRIITAEHRS